MLTPTVLVFGTAIAVNLIGFPTEVQIILVVLSGLVYIIWDTAVELVDSFNDQSQ